MNGNLKANDWKNDQKVLEKKAGIVLLGREKWFVENDHIGDSMPILNGQAGVPSIFTTYVHPDFIQTLIKPNRAEEIYGSVQNGTIFQDVMLYKGVEYGGNATALTDDPQSTAMINLTTGYAQRNQFKMRTSYSVGFMEQGTDALMGFNTVFHKQEAAAQVLNNARNDIFFHGVQGLKTYGVLNDPNQLPPLQPMKKASGGYDWENATPEEIANDVMYAFQKLIVQTAGNISMRDKESPMKLVVANTVVAFLLKTNTYGLSPLAKIKESFPNIELEDAPELATEAGNLLQLFPKEVLGRPIAGCHFSEKMRGHGMIPRPLGFSEELTQGIWGFVNERPGFMVQLLGI